MADVITVSALNKYVRSVLESDIVLTDIAIRGEISNFNRNYKSGHCYFSLKDEKAGVRAVMFVSNAQNVPFSPENGMLVVVRGRVTLYERDGAFQVYVEHMFLDGAGAAQMAFEQLKARLEGEGLFAPEHKTLLPAYPACVGLVTSKTGAALQDVLKVAQKRCPLVKFVLAPVSVQGQQAVPGIVEAIQRLDEDDDVEVIVVTRGGGSAEDLWVFNAEQIAYAAFRCKTPLVSAIGHEIDFTILDFVADLRAPTPSAAAEMVLPDMQATMAAMMNILANISGNMQLRYTSCYNELAQLTGKLEMLGPRKQVLAANEKLALLYKGIRQAQMAAYEGASVRFKGALALAESLNPYGVLARGYGIARSGGRVVKSTSAVSAGEGLSLQLYDGVIDCTVQNVKPEKAENIS